MGYEYSYNLTNSRENWAQKLVIAAGKRVVWPCETTAENPGKHSEVET